MSSVVSSRRLPAPQPSSPNRPSISSETCTAWRASASSAKSIGTASDAAKASDPVHSESRTWWVASSTMALQLIRRVCGSETTFCGSGRIASVKVSSPWSSTGAACVAHAVVPVVLTLASYRPVRAVCPARDC